jgi:putative ABC transport system permease protein
MTFSHFIVKNTFRNKKRLGFTVLSIGFSLFLLIALFTVLDMLLNPPQSDTSILRLVVRRSTSLADPLPLAYEQKIKNVPHVALTMPFQWFGGYWQEPKNFFANLAGDPYRFW